MKVYYNNLDDHLFSFLFFIAQGGTDMTNCERHRGGSDCLLCLEGCFLKNINGNEEVFVRIIIQIYFKMLISLQALGLEVRD